MAYAHLVAANVAAAAGDTAAHQAHHRQAQAAIAALEDPEEQDILTQSMRAIPAPMA